MQMLSNQIPLVEINTTLKYNFKIPFSPETKRMSVCSIYNRDPDRRKTWFVKGAPEIILKSCFALQTQDGRQSMTEKIRRNFMGEFKMNMFLSHTV